jgi:FkbM family methyltransferase
MKTFRSKIIRILKIARNVGAPPTTILKLLWYGCIKPSLAYRGIINPHTKKTFSIQARLGTSKSTAITLSDNGLDICTFLEIFGSGHLNPLNYGADSPKVIYDIGANVGISTLFFSMVFPDSMIHAFEPEPGNYATAYRNLESRPNVFLSKRAISEQIGTMAFECGADTRGGRLVDDGGANSASTQSVEVTTIESLIAEERAPTPDFMKIDVEGAEVAVLTGAGRHLSQVNALNIETHSPELHVACLNLVQNAGFRVLLDDLPPHGMGSIWAARDTKPR